MRCVALLVGGVTIALPSSAATYNHGVEIKLCTTEPAEGSRAAKYAYDLEGEVGQFSGSQTAQFWDGDSWEDWAWLTCEMATDETLWLTFEGATGNWPTSWPDLRCAATGGGDTHVLTIDVVADSACSSGAQVVGWDAELQLYPNEAAVWASSELLPEGTYACDTPISAKKSNQASWAGVSCEAKVYDFGASDSITRLKIDVDKAAVEAVGYCDIPRDSDGDGDIDGNDTPLRVDIDLDRL